MCKHKSYICIHIQNEMTLSISFDLNISIVGISCISDICINLQWSAGCKCTYTSQFKWKWYCGISIYYIYLHAGKLSSTNFVSKLFSQEYHQSGKQFWSISGLTFCWAWSVSKLFANCYHSTRQNNIRHIPAISVICICEQRRLTKACLSLPWLQLVHYNHSPNRKHFFKYWPVWFEHCGYMWHICLPNASQSHVIRPIGWFNIVYQARHHVSLKPFPWNGLMRRMFSKMFQCIKYDQSLAKYSNTYYCYSLAIKAD